MSQIPGSAAGMPFGNDGSLAYDVQRLDSLKLAAKTDPKTSARQVAREFEALFLQQLMKSMQATRFDDEEDSASLQTFKGLQTEQMAKNLAGGRGMGLGEALYQQILKQSGLGDDGSNPLATGGNAVPLALNPRVRAQLEQARRASDDYEPMRALDALDSPMAAPKGREGFVSDIAPHARQAAAQLGVSPHLVVAHAALESGWGKRNIRHRDGSDSYNLFGIKAGKEWTGKTADVLTTEYVNGKAVKKVERFRAYDNYGEAFADYARLLSNNNRYAGALNTGSNALAFARGLARGGYATDPAYAEKLASVAQRTSA